MYVFALNKINSFSNLYQPSDIGKEMIAFYSENLNIEKNDIIFSDYKEFIQNYTIPDFIHYIENHPRCKEIIYSDNKIDCQIAGNHINSEENTDL